MNKKSIIIIVLILFIGIGTYFGLSMLNTPPEEKEEKHLMNLSVIPLKRTTIVPKVAEFALVTSLEEVDVSAEVAGKVVECSEEINDGINVRKGDVLIQIEMVDYEIAKQQAQAEIEILKADKKNVEQNIKDLIEITAEIKKDYELEEKNNERISDLYKRDVSSKSEFEKSQQNLSRRKKAYIVSSTNLSKQRFALQSLIGKIKMADADLEKAKLNLKRSTVRAPINGRIGNWDIEIGEYLSVGKRICTVTNDNKPSLQVPVNASEATDILKVQTGEKHWLKFPDSVAVSLTWVKKPEECRWNAKVSLIENYDSDTDTLRVLVTPTEYAGNKDKPFPLLPGMFCKIIFTGVHIKNAFRIPFSALQFGNNVYTVNGEGILSRHKITPFAIEERDVIILSGLPENEDVVIQQLPRGLISGMKVKPVNNVK